MFEQKELDSAIYEEVVQMRSVRGKEIRQARRDRPKQVQKLLSFLLIKALSLSPPLLFFRKHQVLSTYTASLPHSQLEMSSYTIIR
jgi:hypothetical protein